MENERKYYVYGYKRLDNNTFFYIGKGSNDRCKVKAPSVRTDEFLFIRNHLDYEYVIIHSNLTEEESYKLERETIEKLVNDEGYKINIVGYGRDEVEDILNINTKFLVNRSFGGLGNKGYIPTQETLDKISKNRVGKYKGKRNNKARGVVNINLNLEFDTIQEAIKYFDSNYGIKLLHSKISNCCRGQRLYHGKLNNECLKWRYTELSKEEEEQFNDRRKNLNPNVHYNRKD